MTVSADLDIETLEIQLLIDPADRAAWEQLSMKYLLEGSTDRSAFATAMASQLEDPGAEPSHEAQGVPTPHDPDDAAPETPSIRAAITSADEITLEQLSNYAAEKLVSTAEGYLILSIASGVISVASRKSAHENAALFLDHTQTHVQVREQLVYRDPETGIRIANLSMVPLRPASLSPRKAADYTFCFLEQMKPLVEDLPELTNPLRIQLEGWNGEKLRGWSVFNGNTVIPRVPILLALLDGTPLQVIDPWIERLDVMAAVGSSHHLKAGFEINNLRKHLLKEGSTITFCDPITYKSQESYLLSRYRTFHEQIREVSCGFCGFGVQERQGEVVVTSLPRIVDHHPPKVRQFQKLDILVPVYKNMALTKLCLEALKASVLQAQRQHPDREIYIHATNDCSPEKAVHEQLPEVCDELGIILHQNSENLGFIHTVNNFMKGTDDDILLVNSDVIVSLGCIGELLNTRQEHGPELGTITTFSNNATIFSYPWSVAENGLSSLQAIEQISLAFFRQAHESGVKSLQTPVSHGFLMFITRTAIQEVGFFDEYFGLGYGEEVDWAVRAAMKGFEHYLCTSTFAYHKGCASFGASTRLKAVQNSNRIISERYPFYDQMIQDYIMVDELRVFRNAAAVNLLLKSEKPFLFHITHNSGGGIDKYIQSLADSSDEFTHLIIRSGRSYGDLASGQGASKSLDFTIECSQLDVAVIGDLEGAILSALQSVFREGTRAIVHSVVGWKAEEIEEVMNYLRGACVDYDVVGHDYMTLCPRIKLIDSSGKYCGVGNRQQCSHCLRTGALNVESRLMAPYTSDINLYRQFFAEILNGASNIHCSTAEQRELFIKQGFVNAIVSEPLEPQYSSLNTYVHQPESRNFVVVGGISVEKGAERLFHVASLSMQIDPSAHFYLIGAAANIDKLASLPNFTHVGKYESLHQLHEAIGRVFSPISFFPAIWPETWCYTLSEVMQLGLPIIAPKLGAIGSRLSGIESRYIRTYEHGISNYELTQLLCRGFA